MMPGMRYFPGRFKQGLVIALSAMFMSACTVANPLKVQTPDPTVQFAVTMYPTQIVVASPTMIPTLAAVPSQTPTSVITECPLPTQQSDVPRQPATFTDTVTSIVTFLNTGGSITDTIALLQKWGMIYTSPDTGQLLGGVVKVRLSPAQDSNLVITYYDPADVKLKTRKSELLILQCVNHAFKVIYQASTEPELAGQVTNVAVMSTTGVTGGLNDDLTYVLEDCSDNTCYDGVYVISMVNGKLVNVIPDFNWTPSPKIRFIKPVRNDSTSYDLQVRSGFLGSPGAGPQRVITETWSFVGGLYTLTQSLHDPPVYRIHALMDADTLFRQKDYAAATSLYERVIGDASLQSWAGNAPLRDEPKVLAAFAEFRLMQVATVMGRADDVRKAHSALVALAPAGSAGVIYLHMADAFMDVYKLTTDMQKLCDATMRYADKNKNVFVVIGQDTFGAANYDYQAPDMCIGP